MSGAVMGEIPTSRALHMEVRMPWIKIIRPEEAEGES